MPERRQAHRRETIEVEISTGDVWEVKPLPWTTRNDLGDIIVKQNQDSINDLVRLYYTDVDGTQLPQLELMFSQKIRDWLPIFRIQFPEAPVERFSDLTFDDCVELAIASLDINGLGDLKNLVDPNSQTQVPSGGTGILGLLGMNGPKDEPSLDSESSASPEPTPLISPTPNSETSSTNTTNSELTNEAGS